MARRTPREKRRSWRARPFRTLGRFCSSCILDPGGAMEHVSGFYAHTPGKGSEWHDLVLHLKQTAACARDNTAKFGAAEVGYLAGLWHDLGKFNPDFQEYLVRSESADRNGNPPPVKSVPHAVYGAKLARESYPPLTQIIYGHHGGLPEIERAKARISAPDLAETFVEVTRL